MSNTEAIRLITEVKTHWLTLMEPGDYEASEGEKLDQAIALLEPEPEPAEFTKEFRKMVSRQNFQDARDFEISGCLIVAIREKADEACAKIDRLTAENKVGTEAYAMSQKERMELRAELKAKDAEIARLKGLLGMAVCPNCDGSGAYYDGYGNAVQCQWCYEKNEALKG